MASLCCGGWDCACLQCKRLAFRMMHAQGSCTIPPAVRCGPPGALSFYCSIQTGVTPASQPAMPGGACFTPPASSTALQDLVEKCTQWEPDKRPTFQDVLAALRAATEPADPGKPPAVAQQLVNPI